MYNFSSEIFYLDCLTEQSFLTDKDLLIFDQALLEEPVRNFIKSFKYSYGVRAGENLKDIDQLPKHIKNILSVWNENISREHRIVTFGGGSVGDFSGFIASILKRGIRLSHIPSTWLAAVDSAHGGKTALNVSGVKNQIGTFYPAEQIYLVKEILLNQPPELAFSALGEIIKMSMIATNSYIKAILQKKDLPVSELVWNYLKPSVDAKYYYVKKDPLEQQKIRKILNLGHTWGHVLESYYQKPHGDCVLQGLYFALLWSQGKKRLSFEDFSLFEDLLVGLNLQIWHKTSNFKKIPMAIAKDLICKDKKITSAGKIDFVFLKTFGEPVVEPVDIEDILNEAVEQGWVE